MAFIDEVQLEINAGNGGDGGRGGDVYAQAIDDLAYLEYYRFTKKFQAQHGEPGGNLGKEGANGESLTLRFPRGTVLTNKDTGEQFEIVDTEEKILILKGGRNGLGNEHFKSSTNTTPYEWTPGTLGEGGTFHAELRLFADAGFVGLPSAGKSTLLNSLTNAKSKVGAYHFTTLEPHLGALGSYILADIPGLIKGASEGKGLGYKFLKHLSRTNILVHVIGLDTEDVVSAYQEIRNELEAYDANLASKKEILLLSKTDLVDSDMVQEAIQKLSSVYQGDIYTISAYDDDSIKVFKEKLLNILEKETA